MKRTTLFKLLRYGFFGLVCLVTLLALIVAEENFRGKRAWENYKRDALARGQKFDLNFFIPPPVPDDQNFAVTPLLKPLFDKDPTYKKQLDERLQLPEPKAGKAKPSMGNRVTGKQFNLAEWSEYLGDPDVLHALKRFDPEMNEISVASRKSYSRFPLRYEDGFQVSLPHLPPLMALSKLFAIRGSANLALGHPSEAFGDCETLLHLADAQKGEPLLISELVRISILSIGQNVIWQGLSAHQWSEEQLSALQMDLQRIDQLGDSLSVYQCEMTWGPSCIEKIMGDSDSRKVMSQMMSSEGDKGASIIPYFPSGWLYQNMITYCRFGEDEIFPAFDLSARRFSPHKVATAERRGTVSTRQVLRHPYSVLVELGRGSVTGAIPRCIYAQTSVDEAAIACALERYRLVHHDYPENLNALVPQYFDKLPHDVITGEPLHYRRTSDDRFTLYSVGWNEIDDHGTVATKKESKSQQDITQGDWVW